MKTSTILIVVLGLLAGAALGWAAKHYLPNFHLGSLDHPPKPAMSQQQVKTTEHAIRVDTTQARQAAHAGAAAHDSAGRLATQGRAATAAAIQLLTPSRPKPRRHVALPSTSSRRDSIEYYQRVFAD